MKNYKGSCSSEQIELQMAVYAREIVLSQPNRLFGHALYLEKLKVHLYHLDRCRALDCTPFDIHADWKTFVAVVLAYSYMNEQDMGFDTAFTPPDGRDTVPPFDVEVVAASAAAEKENIQLADSPPSDAEVIIPSAAAEKEDIQLADSPPSIFYNLRLGDNDYRLTRMLQSQRSLIGRATVCWGAQQISNSLVHTDGNFVIKNS